MPEHKGQLVVCDCCGAGRLDTADTTEVQMIDGRWICEGCVLAYLEGKKAGLEEALSEMRKEGKNDG